MVGTVSRGVRAPIIRDGDNLVDIVVDSVLAAANDKEDGFEVRNRDVIAVTEAVVARAQNNYATVDDIAADVKAKFGGDTVGVIFPILSRNRFAICLRGIAKGAKKSLKKGLGQGQDIERRKIAKALKKKGIPDEIIASCTNLTIEEIKNFKVKC